VRVTILITCSPMFFFTGIVIVAFLSPFLTRDLSFSSLC
jgi:hypothetical protein